MGGAISSSQSDAQVAFEKYQKRKNSYRVEQKAEEEQTDQKAAAILQEFKERPWPEALPRACEVVPDIFIGSLYDAMDGDWIERTGITHAVSGTLAQNPFVGKVQRFVAIVDDEDPSDVWRWFERVCQFIDGALQDGGRVLVHCEWGVSRSPTLAAAYLMRSQGCTAAAALEHLKGVRDCVRPNKHFQGALKEWQGTLHIEEPLLEEEAKPDEQCKPESSTGATEPLAQSQEKCLEALGEDDVSELIVAEAESETQTNEKQGCEVDNTSEVKEEPTQPVVEETSAVRADEESLMESPPAEQDPCSVKAPKQEDASEPNSKLPSKEELTMQKADEGTEQIQEVAKETSDCEDTKIAADSIIKKEVGDESNATNDLKDEKLRSIKGRKKKNNKAWKKQGLQQTSEAHQRYEC